MCDLLRGFYLIKKGMYTMVKELTMANPPPDEVRKYLSELAKRLDDIGFELNVFKSEMSSRFKLKIQKDLPIFTNVIVIPIKESVAYSKIKRSAEKSVEALIVNDKLECTPVSFNGDELTGQGFKKKLMMFREYGLMTDKDYSKLFDLFMASAKFGLESTVEYNEEGLTGDHRYVIYKGDRIPVHPPDTAMGERLDPHLRSTFDSFISCAPPGKSLLLLLVQLTGLSMEIIKALPPDKRRNCLQTVLPYIWGDSGCGKTTISKAFFDAHDESRFIALSTSTEAAIQNKLSSVFGGVIVIDDVQHTGIGKCSSKTTEKLEAVIRTFGDIGAEKATAAGKLSETGAWAVVTAESIFTAVESSVLRLLPIKFSCGEIDFERVQHLENCKGDTDEFFQNYLKWFLSQVTVKDGEILDIRRLTEGYHAAKSEIINAYGDIPHARISDNHCQMLNFFNFVSDFFGRIGVEDSKLADLKKEMLICLHDSAMLQCAHVYESSLPYYICRVIESIITEGNIAKFSNAVDSPAEIEVKEDSVKLADAYKKDNYLIFTASQQRELFSKIRKSLPNGSNVRGKDIKQALISMRALVDPRNDELLTYLSKENRIKINNKETRVLKIKTKFLKEERYYE